MKRETLIAITQTLKEYERLGNERRTRENDAARAKALDRFIDLSRELLTQAGWPLPEDDRAGSTVMGHPFAPTEGRPYFCATCNWPKDNHY